VDHFATGHSILLLRNGAEYFPALIKAIDAAEQEVWLETYIFADDASGRQIAAAMVRAAQRGVTVRVLVDGWGARQFLTPSLAQMLRSGGVRLMKYRPEIAPWQFRSHRLRRLHRKVCHVDGRVAFVGGINLIDDMNTPRHKPPRVDFAVRVEGPMLATIVMTMQRLWALVELTQFDRSDVPLFPVAMQAQDAGTQVAKIAIRDNLGHRQDIEQSYMAAILTAKKEILIATAYFFPGIHFRRALTVAAQRGVQVTLLLQARVEYRLLHYASRALYGQLLGAGVSIQEYHRSFLHAKVAVVDDHWATVGSSNIDPYSLLMAREANVFVRDPYFADQLRLELVQMVSDGARRVAPERWAGRGAIEKALTWIAYGIVRVGMGVLGYGGNEWFPRKSRRGTL
jgi:cardiolipin synthase A/B